MAQKANSTNLYLYMCRVFRSHVHPCTYKRHSAYVEWGIHIIHLCPIGLGRNLYQTRSDFDIVPRIYQHSPHALGQQLPPRRQEVAIMQSLLHTEPERAGPIGNEPLLPAVGFCIHSGTCPSRASSIPHLC